MLASYCLHALTAASSLPSKAPVRRLVTVTLDPAPNPTASYGNGQRRSNNMCDAHTHSTPQPHKHQRAGEKHSHARIGHEHPHAHEAGPEDVHEREHA